MRSHADYIAVVFSRHSYYGAAAAEGLEDLLRSLQAQGLIDELVEYKPEVFAKDGDRARRREIEVEKRNVGLEMARAARCDYFMSMDTDEFYDGDAFAHAKNTILKKGVTHSFVHILNYGRLPTQLSNIRKWEYFVPFFSKIVPGSVLGSPGTADRAPCLVDPTRIMSYFDGARDYVLEDIFMHHYTRVRADLGSKYVTRQVSSDIDADWIDGETNFIAVPDYFALTDAIDPVGRPPGSDTRIRSLVRNTRAAVSGRRARRE